MTGRRVMFCVSLDLPPGATPTMAREYVNDAVRSMCGCLQPPGHDEYVVTGDPMFELDRDGVRVWRARRSRK